MSTWVDTSVTCPACAAAVSVRVATSVHITRVPEVRTYLSGLAEGLQ